MRSLHSLCYLSNSCVLQYVVSLLLIPQNVTSGVDKKLRWRKTNQNVYPQELNVGVTEYLRFYFSCVFGFQGLFYFIVIVVTNVTVFIHKKQDKYFL